MALKYNNSPLKERGDGTPGWEGMTTGGKYAAIASFGLSRIGAKGRNKRKREQAAAKEAFGNQMQAYQDFQFENPYANMENQFAGMENPYEDLRVDTTAQELAGNQYAQSLANMSGAMDPSNVGQFLRGAAGQAAGMRAQTAQQEIANQRMAAQGAADIQLRERTGQASIDQLQAQGAATVQGLEFGRQESILGMAAGRKQAADQARQQNTQMWMNLAGSAIGAGGEVAAAASDRKLKKNISKIGESPSGLNIYSFEYKDSKFGSGKFQGVMADEAPNHAVINNGEYDMVDYSIIDVDFKQL